jgi:hypothetical protein
MKILKYFWLHCAVGGQVISQILSPFKFSVALIADGVSSVWQTEKLSEKL